MNSINWKCSRSVERAMFRIGFILICVLLKFCWEGNCEGYAVSTALSQKICKQLQNYEFGHVSSKGITPSLCPIYTKDSKRWGFNACDSGGGTVGKLGQKDEGDGRNFGKITGKNNPDEQKGDGWDIYIMNGRDAPPFAHPYVAYIRARGQKKGISGTIYNKYTILVNSLLFLDLLKKVNHKSENLRIHIGKHKHEIREHEEQVRWMCNYTAHPEYVHAVIHLSDPLTLNNYVDGIPLADESQNKGYSCPCLAPGWGSPEVNSTVYQSDIMQEANTTLFKCPQEVKPGPINNCSNPVYCMGDTGSPAVCTHKHRITAAALLGSTGMNPDTPCYKSTYSVWNNLRIPDFYKWVDSVHEAARSNCRTCANMEYYD